MMFPTDLASIENRVKQIEPVRYAKTRNFKSGAVSRLSPYISRGVISTQQVFNHLLELDLEWKSIEKFVQELAWRDYWQQVWIAKREGIFQDLKQEQQPIANHQMPTAVLEGDCGIEAVDQALEEFYQSGYLHNHMRMYIAAICCNVAKAHWLTPARWMYANLLDGDLASNHLSWQWVAGANANKKYYANQENINKFFESNQRNTFLDVAYEAFDLLPTPEVLKESAPFEMETALPKTDTDLVLENRKTLLYNYYNLDPYWHAQDEMQSVLLLEPSIFKKHPVSKKCIDFTLALAQNIPNIKVMVGEFSELEKQIDTAHLIYKEHPLNAHYKGTEEARDWMFSVTGYFPSFFKFWNKCLKSMKGQK